MTGIVHRTKSILYHQYPDRWLDATLAFGLGALSGVLSLVFTRDMSSSTSDLPHAVCLWAITGSFLLSAAGLLSNRRWGYALLAGPFLLAAVSFARDWSIITAGLFFWVFLHYLHKYRAACFPAGE